MAGGSRDRLAAGQCRSSGINAILADGRFWTEPSYTQACPDFGSSNILLKIPGKSETVRIAQCSSIAASLVEAALRG